MLVFILGMIVGAFICALFTIQGLFNKIVSKFKK